MDGGVFFAGKGGCGVRVLELVGGKLCEDLRRFLDWDGRGSSLEDGSGRLGKRVGGGLVGLGWGGVALKKGGSVGGVGWLVRVGVWRERRGVCVV